MEKSLSRCKAFFWFTSKRNFSSSLSWSSILCYDILMDSLLQSQVFFFVSSVGFVILGILVVMLLFYLIRISQSFSRIINKAEKDINSIGDTTKEILEEIRDNSLFQFLTKFFKKKRTKSK